MSSKSDLEGEEFEEVTLVRMEDIQPSRGSQIVVNYVKPLPDENETCTEDSYIDYLDDDDSNIGSMVSIKSETVPIEHNYSEKYIVPDPYVDIPLEKDKNGTEMTKVKVIPTDSWPTLEILPGGVIRHAEKPDEHNLTNDSVNDATLDKLYACARCSDSYRDLYSLVKHVKCHENEKKIKDHTNIKLIKCHVNEKNMKDHTNISIVEGNWSKSQETRKRRLLSEKKSITKKVPKRRKI